jgi:cell wall-associated NlpC family hydrolase
MGKRKTVSGLAIAGLAVWLLTDKKTEKEPAALPAPAVTEQPPVAPEPAVAAAFATRRPSWRRRTATTLVFTALFFAGAALSAGAGNIVAHIDAGSTDAAAVDAAPTGDTTDTTDTTATDTTATDTTATDTSTDAATTTTDATTTDVSTTDATVTTPATPDGAATTDAAPAAEPVAADPADATPSAAPAAAQPAAAAAPASTPAPAPATPAAPPVAAVRKVDHPVSRVSVVPSNGPTVAPAASPFPVIAFDPQAWLVDHPGTPAGDAAVSIAERYLGVPYVWGGNTPSTGFDCSGLTQFVYAQLGVWLPHYAAAQFLAYPRLDPSQLAPGDLVFFEPKADGPGHVAIYAGNGQIIEAPHTGAVVRVGSLAGAAASLGFLGAVRPAAGPLALVRRVSAVVAAVKPVPQDDAIGIAGALMR